MADQEDDDFQLAMRMSMPSSPKRSKHGGLVAAAIAPEDTRRLQRELMAAAAEKRMIATRPPPSKAAGSSSIGKGLGGGGGGGERDPSGKCLTEEEAEELFCMVFGAGVSKSILAQWTNQGIR